MTRQRRHGRGAGDRRGRQAETPKEIPKRGWKDILLRVKDELNEDNVDVVAAGVAFYAMLAIFPALAALVSIYGLAFDPAEVEQQIAAIQGILPQEAAQIINEQLHRIVTSEKSGLSLGAIGGLLLTLWSAGKGVKTLFVALNIVYDEQERRGFIKLNLMALGFTLVAILLVILLLLIVVGVPAVVEALHLRGAIGWLVSILRWPVVGLVLVLAMAVLFRYGPSRDEPRWQWVSWGAVGATLLWIAGSMLFSWYVSNFASYNETYGSLGAVVILLMWFYLSAYIVLLAAEVNAEMEHQTARDTTEGRPKPRGRRDAYVADTVGKAR